MANFTERLLSLKSQKNISYDVIAHDIGISLRALKYYSSAEREPSMSTLISLADYFDVSLDYLVGRSDNPKRI